jgi:hypothetical protein
MTLKKFKSSSDFEHAKGEREEKRETVREWIHSTNNNNKLPARVCRVRVACV